MLVYVLRIGLPQEDRVKLLAAGADLRAHFALEGEIVGSLKAVGFWHDLGCGLLDLDDLGLGQSLDFL